MKLVLSKKADFSGIYKEMRQNFCLDEIRDFPQAEEICNNENYFLYNLCENDQVVGFIALWQFDGFAFVEHFVIYEKYRNKGLGAKALDAVKNNFGSVVLEVEPPEGDMASRRFAFYQRQGFVPNDYPYMQPSYRKNGNEVRLILMSYPNALIDAKHAVSEIYINVYGKEFI